MEAVRDYETFGTQTGQDMASKFKDEHLLKTCHENPKTYMKTIFAALGWKQSLQVLS
jgi:hypothetical protein